MAQSIKFLTYGDETCNGVPVKHVLAELWDGPTLLARRLIQGITSETDRDAKAQAAFEGIKAAEVAPAAPSTVGWKATVTKAAKAVEPG